MQPSFDPAEQISFSEIKFLHMYTYKVLSNIENISRTSKSSLILKLTTGNALLCKECHKGNQDVSVSF